MRKRESGWIRFHNTAVVSQKGVCGKGGKGVWDWRGEIKNQTNKKYHTKKIIKYKNTKVI